MHEKSAEQDERLWAGCAGGGAMTGREQVEKAAADHGWAALIESGWGSEYHKGDQSLTVYYRQDGSVKDVIYYRGNIGLAHLAPADGASDSAVRWLGGQR